MEFLNALSKVCSIFQQEIFFKYYRLITVSRANIWICTYHSRSVDNRNYAFYWRSLYCCLIYGDAIMREEIIKRLIAAIKIKLPRQVMAQKQCFLVNLQQFIS